MIAVGAGMMVVADPDSLDMVVVAFLARADLAFEPEHLLAALAGLVVHGAGSVQDLVHPADVGIVIGVR
ncbi:MAG: hypothetical protein OXQ29_17400 [Rhodospirillaceae bacterium]|nr:hypothetical protein [Rhodospirillaceae bacterium]